MLLNLAFKNTVVEQLGSRTSGNCRTNGCRTNGMSNMWDPICSTAHLSDKNSKLSNKWEVEQMGSRTIGLSDKWVSEKWETPLNFSFK